MTDSKIKQKNALVPQKQASLSVVSDYGSDSGSGFESTGARDLSIPFLSILQTNSPQITEGDFPHLKAGFLFNTVTKEGFSGDEGVAFLPVHKEVSFVEWVPRDEGGGFVGLHDPSSEVVRSALSESAGRKTAKLFLGNGNDLIETHYVYGLLLDKTGKKTTGFAVVSFTSTKIKPCRDWMTALYTLKGRPPIFANRALIKTTKQTNRKGSFFNFKIEPLFDNWISSLISPTTEANLLEEARDFRKMVTSGIARAAFDSQTAAGDSDSDGDVPF